MSAEVTTHEATPRNWEQEIRQAFEKSLNSPDPIEQALAQEVLEMERLNIWCFEIAPKITKVLIESKNPLIKSLSFRLWSSIEEGHVAVFATDKKTQKIYVIEAAGLLSKDGPNDSSLGITVLNPQERYQLFANPNRQQYISPEIDKRVPFIDQPQTEEEMQSSPLRSLTEVIL
jgi:hypothetical protein